MGKRISLRDLPKHERVSELLRLFGNDMIKIEEFWSQMREYGLDDDDIDAFCEGKHVE